MQSTKWESLALIPVYVLSKLRSSDNSHKKAYLSVCWPSRIHHILQPCISTHAENDHSKPRNAMKCLFSSKDLSGRRTINTNSFVGANERVKAIHPPIIQTHRNYFHIIKRLGKEKNWFSPYEDCHFHEILALSYTKIIEKGQNLFIHRKIQSISNCMILRPHKRRPTNNRRSYIYKPEKSQVRWVSNVW